MRTEFCIDVYCKHCQYVEQPRHKNYLKQNKKKTKSVSRPTQILNHWTRRLLSNTGIYGVGTQMDHKNALNFFIIIFVIRIWCSPIFEKPLVYLCETFIHWNQVLGLIWLLMLRFPFHHSLHRCSYLIFSLR